MHLPTATYRLQFREHMDFARAETLVPYLADLGVSHLYASPLFTATPGSTHGYDVTDPNEIEPSLGGRAGLEKLSAKLREHGLGLILDIVPNHMAFNAANPWLHDVLANGLDSAYAGHFDIDWSDRLRLPWLPEPFAAMAEKGDVTTDGTDMIAGDLRVPLAVTGPEDIRELHDAQPWRLTHWRTESAAISHRRFFTVTGLIGVRVEDDAVFDDMHRLTFELIDAGIANGLRVDHVDGLADPAGYLAKLRDRVGDRPVWVEKILTGDERLPEEWPVQGTTGYVAARAIAQVLTDAAGAEELDARTSSDFRRVLAASKRQIVTTELPAELDRLVELALSRGGEWGRGAWREAIIRYVGAFPRYRTYATMEAVSEADAEAMRDNVERAKADMIDTGAIDDLLALLLDPDCGELRVRLQQLTGAAIAKAQEDTAFYRYTPLLSANEVGGEPDEPALDIAGFHEAMQVRQATMPGALTLTSSHDTKRSEDARMRIAAISHDVAMRDTLRELTDLPAPWGWYLAQSAFAAQPEGELADRLADHMTKAMREAKRDTFWTSPDKDYEARVTGAARDIAGAIDPLPEAVAPLADRAANLSLAQCALKLTIPGIPDIYQGTEIGSFRLTDPDNRAVVDFDALARGETETPFDAAKLALTRTLLHLRRDRPDLLEAPYAPRDAEAGILAFTRGDLLVEVSVDGTHLPEASGPVRLTLDGTALL